MNNEKKQKFVVIMRHGERGDDLSLNNEDVQSKTINPHDPFLTEKGFRQAVSIGEQLENYFTTYFNKSITESKISLHSSPFIRTYETSRGVLTGGKLITNEQKLKDNATFKINIGLYECITKSMFRQHPHNHLNFFVDKKINKICLDIQIINEELLPSYPETISESISRYNKVILQLLQDFNKDENEILIIVTHGYGVQVMCDYLNRDVFTVDYCSTFLFQLNEYEQGQFIEEFAPIL